MDAPDALVLAGAGIQHKDLEALKASVSTKVLSSTFLPWTF